MNTDSRLIELADLGVVRIQGTDAERFLQGQLSNDMARLAAEGSLLAGYHNPQGRVIALLRLVHLAADEILAVLPRELAASVASRLSRFVLRAKVQVADDSTSWRVRGLIAPEAEQLRAAAQPAPVRIARDPDRWLIASRLGELDPPASCTTAQALAWRTLDVQAGIPQVYSQTTEAFVAQMLNLDLVDAISFDKGCYTGQEVIARAHYRGRVKRRMQRFRTREPAALARGASGRLPDGGSFKVVEAVPLADGRCEFLAVAPLTPADDEPSGESADVLQVERLSVPYSLPN